MKKTIVLSLFLALTISCTQDRNVITETVLIDPNSELIYYWNFNMLSGSATDIPPDYSLSVANANITYLGDGAGYMDGDTGGYTLNSRNNDLGENLLKVRNPSITRSLLLTLPTDSYKQVVVRFAVARSNSGATVQNYTYTVDGANYTNNGLTKISHAPSVDPTIDLVTLDFSTITAVNNNPNFKVKIEFSGDAAAGLSGNNRFDNVTLEAVAN